MNLDLLNDDPQRLAREAPLDDLLAAVRAVEDWTDRHGQVLDHLERHKDVGGGHACGRQATARLFCWGNDATGAVGDGGTDTDQPEPVEVA